jgi:hypothetical protein
MHVLILHSRLLQFYRARCISSHLLLSLNFLHFRLSFTLFAPAFPSEQIIHFLGGGMSLGVTGHSVTGQLLAVIGY